MQIRMQFTRFLKKQLQCGFGQNRIANTTFNALSNFQIGGTIDDLVGDQISVDLSDAMIKSVERIVTEHKQTAGL